MAKAVVPEPEERDYVALAHQYAKDVASGKIVACRHVKQAAQRHLADLKKYGSWTPGDKGKPKGEYYFDPVDAAKPCAFGELLPHVKGKWAKARKLQDKLIVLQPWQCFILCCIFGWKKIKNDRRRFNIAYIEIPRKNGKSVLAAIIGLYMFSMDDEVGAEVYSGATSQKQAMEVFRPAKAMFEHEAADELRDLVSGKAFAKSLTTGDGSRFEPLIGKPGDGASPSCAIADEFHEHDTSEQVDTMETGMGAREQPLLLIITTAGVNLAGPCYERRGDAVKMLEGVTDHPELFAVIYSIDLPEHDGEQGDDWTSPTVLQKANPNWGISIEQDFLLAKQRQAVLNPVHATTFKTKHLNVWCSAKLAWMPMPAWLLCGDAQLAIDEFMGQEAWFTLDLASRDDIASFGVMFRRLINNMWHYYGFERYYVPEARMFSEDNPNAKDYQKWHAQGWLVATEGEEIDFATIRADVLDYKSRFQVKEIAYDPWRATQLMQECRAEGVTTVEVRQIIQHFSAPMKEVLSAVKGGRYHHCNNPMTNWMVGNTRAKTDTKDNIMPVKEPGQPHSKIDGSITIIMGMNRCYVPSDEGTLDDWLKGGSVVSTAKYDKTRARA